MSKEKKPIEITPVDMFRDAVAPAVNFLVFLEKHYSQGGDSTIIINSKGATLYHHQVGMKASIEFDPGRDLATDVSAGDPDDGVN